MDRLDVLLLKTEPIIGRFRAKRLRQLASLNQEMRRFVELKCQSILSQKVDSSYSDAHILLPPPSRGDAKAAYELGEVMYADKPLGYSWGINPHELVKSLTLTGVPGSGKSNAGFLLLQRLTEDGKPWLALDFKRSSRHILSKLWAKDVQVFTVGRDISPLYWNPLIPPPNVPPQDWVHSVTQSIGHAFFEGAGVEYLFYLAIDNVYKKYGIYEKGHRAKVWPVWQELWTEIDNLQQSFRQSQWKDSARRALHILQNTNIANTVNVRVPFPFERIVEKQVIVEMESISEKARKFLIDSMLLYLYSFFLSQESSREKFNYCIVVEEAHHLADPSTERFVTPPINTLLRQFRELGVGVVLIDQYPSKMSIEALSTFTSIAFNQKHQRDVDTIGGAMLLDRDQRKFLGELDVGYAIVKQQGRYAKPFLIKVPFSGVKKGVVTDAMLKERAGEQPFITPTAIVPTIEFPDPSLVSAGKKGKDDQRREREVQRQLVLDTDMVRVLQDVTENRSSTFDNRTKRLVMTAYRADQVKKELVRRNLVNEREKLSPKKRYYKSLSLTDQGEQFLTTQKELLRRTPQRHGSDDHRRTIDRERRHWKKKGWTATVEKPLGGGRSVDLHVEKDGRRIAIEVETGSSIRHAVSNVNKCLDAGYDEVHSVALDERVSGTVIEALSLSGLDKHKKVRVRTATDDETALET